MRRVLEALLLPPASALLLLLVGTLLVRRRRRLGRTLQFAGVLWLWLASTPACAGLLIEGLQTFPPLPPTGTLPAAQAIVVLSAEADIVGAEYGGAVAGPVTMQRLRYAVALQRRTNLPLLTSGGSPARGAPSLARVMADAAEREFGVPVRWREERSADTRENAQFSAELLRASGVQTVLLVTSAWHMPRSVAAFERAGLQVVAAPTAFRTPVGDPVTAWLPHWHGLRDTGLALHEWLGRAFYAVSG
jgi:uncharacterized SAM-binding protein YcdF (DUF218 family)